MFDVIRFLTTHNIPHFTSGKNVSEGWVSVQCPLCGDTSNHGAFNVAGGYYYCWKCRGSSLGWVIKHLIDVSYSQAIALIEDYDADVVRSVHKRKSGSRTSKITLPGGALSLMQVRYLEGRGFDVPFIVEKYGVRGGIRTGTWAHRIIIPIMLNGRVVAWQGRTIHPDVDAKYLSSSNEESILPAKDVLYNIDNCHDRRAIIVEGPLDVWKVGDGACATLGIGYSSPQVTLVLERFDDVYLLFDSEDTAQARADDLATRLSHPGKRVEVVTLPSGDPGDMTSDEVHELRRELGFTTS